MGDTQTQIDDKVQQDQSQQQAPPDNKSGQQQDQKPTDPFASVKLEQQKQDDKSGQQKKDDKKIDAKDDKGQQQGDKKMARKPDSPEHLQERVKQQNAKISTQETELKTLRSEVETLRAKSGGDTSAMTKEIETYRSEIQRLKSELGAKDFTKSDEYTSKYDKPFNNAAEYAKEIVESLSVLSEDGTERQMSFDKDFAPIYRLQRAAALKSVRDMFPEDPTSVATVMNHYDELKKLDRVRQSAITEWQKTSTDRDQKSRSEQLQVQQKTCQAFQTVTEALRDSDEMFHENPDDAERSAIWKQSQAIVDDAYFNRAKKSVQELVTLDAAIRLRAINEPVLRHALSKAMAELADYKARFDGKEQSRSGNVRRPGNAPAGDKEETNWQEELRSTLQNPA